MSDKAVHHIHSPSALRAQELCPGMVNLVKECQDEPEEDNEYSSKGIFLHHIMALAVKDRLSQAEAATMDANEQALVSRLLTWITTENIEGADTDTLDTEVQLSADDGEGSELYSGTADVMAATVQGNGIVVDWKFGHLPVEEAPDNVQLAAYALAAHDCYGVKCVKVYLVQPNLDNITSHVFSDWESIRSYIKGIIAATQKPDAIRIPGAVQCRYCKAKRKCPECLAAVNALMALRLETLPPIEQWTDDQTSRVYWQFKAVESFIEKAVRPELVRRCNAQAGDEKACGSVILGKGRTTQAIVNVPLAFRTAQENGITEAECFSTVKMSATQIADLMAVVIQASKQKQGKFLQLGDCKRTALELLGSAVEERTGEPIPRRRKDYIETGVLPVAAVKALDEAHIDYRPTAEEKTALVEGLAAVQNPTCGMDSGTGKDQTAIASVEQNPDGTKTITDITSQLPGSRMPCPVIRQSDGRMCQKFAGHTDKHWFGGRAELEKPAEQIKG